MKESFPPDIKARLIEAWENVPDEKKSVIIRELEKRFSISKSAISQWFKPHTRGVGIGRLVDLSEQLNVNLVWLLSGQGERERAKEMSADDFILLRKIRKLNAVDRKRVDKRIDELLEDYEETKQSFRMRT